MQYLVAASVVVLLVFNLWLFTFNSDTQEEKYQFLANTENALLNSLLIDDEDVDTYANDILINEIVIKAELSEQKMDDMFLNTLFVEDSLIDNYTNDQLIENLIL